MATFYLLPPRSCLEQAVSDLFGKLLPGLPLPADVWDALASHLGGGRANPSGTGFLVLPITPR